LLASCCARAASGRVATAAPPRVMNSRRFISKYCSVTLYASVGKFFGTGPSGPMSAPGQKRRFDCQPITSGLPCSTDIRRAGRHVSKLPIRPVAVTAPFFDCPGITDEIYDCPCSLFVERPTPCARTYANQSVEDSREVALIAEAARQGHSR
jgi:hypothetical protein